MNLTIDEVFVLQDAVVSLRKSLFKSLEDYSGPRGELELSKDVVAHLTTYIGLINKLKDEAKILRAAERPKE